MPPRRTTPPSTPFGAWLERWLDQNREWTHDAFAKAVGVSKGLISQWISGIVQKPEREAFQGVARVTGTPFEVLENMVYGGEPKKAAGQYVRYDELEPLMERAAEKAIRRVLRERGEGPAR